MVAPTDGHILARAGNQICELNDPTAHAEILAIRSDNTVECWYREKLPQIEGGWLEIMHGAFNSEEASIDSSFERGKLLAEAALTSIC